MTRRSSEDRAEQDRALTSRLQSVAAILVPTAGTGSAHSAGSPDAGWLLDQVIRSIQDDPRIEKTWLLYTALATVFPSAEELLAAARAIELGDPAAAALAVLDLCLTSAVNRGTPERAIEIVRGAVLVDVDFSARNDVHTGIQRVVRSTLPHWVAEHDLLTSVWTPLQGALRTLTSSEQDRVLRWRDWRAALDDTVEPQISDDEWTVLIPWECTLVIAEVPYRGVCDRLATLAEHSGNAVVGIGYDCIPIVSANLVPLDEPNRFVKYLTVVKHMRRVAGISVSATAEFSGFAQMLPTQGLPGPAVMECALPAETPTELSAVTSSRRPLVMCVGSFEPRKNQMAVLYAAEVLWREGIDFQLRFIGGGGVSREFPSQVARLARRGRPVSIATAVTDGELDDTYAAARFSVFASVHEGYGLPVAESLAHGTPVITSNYGSTREIALDGGTVLVDPRDDEALVDAMRSLLCDDDRIATLRAQIVARPSRSWRDYADDLWATLIDPAMTR